MNTPADIDSLLQSFCARQITRAADIDDRYVELWQEINDYLLSGGKRMRPRLISLAYDAYAEHDKIDIAPIAAAWELLHACLLVHDDIIDRDLVRHGKPNIAGRYQKLYGALSTSDVSHYALSTALLGGDLLLMSAYEMITTAPISSDARILAVSYINQALFTVAGGELIDTDAVLYPISKTNPHTVAAHKTASYSLQLPLKCGAALAGAPAGELEKLSQIGLHAGVAYQLRDDILGVFSDSAVTGKSNRSDIIEKKRTALIHQAISSLSVLDANRITDIFSPGHLVTEDEAEEVVQLIITSGAKDVIEQTIDSESLEALKIVKTLDIDDGFKDSFTYLIKTLTTRTS